VIPEAAWRRFDAEGYLVARGLLDPERDLDPLRQGFPRLVDDLARVLLRESAASLLDGWDELSFPERFATLFGAGGRQVIQHLDPSFHVYESRYRHRADLPCAQIPEIFRLMRCAPLLDALEGLLGPEIDVSPVHHFNLKLSRADMGRAAAAARAVGQRKLRLRRLGAFAVSRFPWHADSTTALPDVRDGRVVIAWIPLTECTTENGCLLVDPGSHRRAGPEGVVTQEPSGRTLEMTASPGDVVFMHYDLLHCAKANETAGERRFSFNFRYAPRGTATGRPFLPGFTARSRSRPEAELCDPELWAAIWRAALANVENERPLQRPAGMTREQAREITRSWRQRVPDDRAWLSLPAAPRRGLGLRRLLRRA